MEISGDAAYITGGARGIGREIRIELADHGLTVAMADLNDAPGTKSYGVSKRPGTGR